MRFTDMVMAFPRLVLLIMIIALFEPVHHLIIAGAGPDAVAGHGALVRGEVLSLREQEYIQAARRWASAAPGSSCATSSPTCWRR
jgi:peptide/nickel transport system permease protein